MHYKCSKKKNEKKIGKACHKNKESLMKSLSQKIKMKQAKKKIMKLVRFTRNLLEMF